MIALYILGGMALYLGIGTKCAKIDIDDSIKNEHPKETITGNAVFAMWAWPWWVITELPRQLLERATEKRMAANKLQLENDIEVQKLLDSGEVDRLLLEE